MVRLKGLEPTRLSTREPKSRMSTNSITGASISSIKQPLFYDLLSYKEMKMPKHRAFTNSAIPAVI